MEKKTCIFCTLTVIATLAVSSPVNLGALEFDNIDADLSELGYEVEEEDLDDFTKNLDDAYKSFDLPSEKNDSKTSIKSSGTIKKKERNKDLKKAKNVFDLKKLFKAAGLFDEGSYDDDNVYALADGVIASAVGTDTNESKTYNKGTKTRGFHHVHHKDEYKKDQEFFEDDIRRGTVNKARAKVLGVKLGAGAGFNKGNFHHDRRKGIYGKQGYSDKGQLSADTEEYSNSHEDDGSFINDR